MSWYEDPTGLAAKITAAIGSLVTLVMTLVAFAKGDGDVQSVLSAVAPAVATAVAVAAILAARKHAFAPQTVAEQPLKSVEWATAEAVRNSL